MTTSACSSVSSQPHLLVLMPGDERAICLACPARNGSSASLGPAVQPGENSALSAQGRRRGIPFSVSSDSSLMYSAAALQAAGGGGVVLRPEAHWLPRPGGLTERVWSGGSSGGSFEDVGDEDAAVQASLDDAAAMDMQQGSSPGSLSASLRRQLSRARACLSSMCPGKGVPTRDGWLTALQLAGMSHAFFC